MKTLQKLFGQLALVTPLQGIYFAISRSMEFLFIATLFISTVAFSQTPPTSECAFTLADLTGHDIFIVARKFAHSKEIKFPGYIRFSPILEEDLKTGALLVYVEKGTPLKDRPQSFQGIPVNYKEAPTNFVSLSGVALSGDDLEAAEKHFQEIMARVYPVWKSHQYGEFYLAILRIIQGADIHFARFELSHDAKGLLSLYIHFSNAEDLQGNAPQIIELLDSYKEQLPIILTSEADGLTIYL